MTRLMPGLPKPVWHLAGCTHRCGSARVWVWQWSWVSTKPWSSPLCCMPARPRLSTRGMQRNSIVSISTAFANCWKWSGRTKCPTQRFSSRQIVQRLHHALQVTTPLGWTCHQDVWRTTTQAPSLWRTADWSALSWRPEETLQGHTQSLHEGF